MRLYINAMKVRNAILICKRFFVQRHEEVHAGQVARRKLKD